MKVFFAFLGLCSCLVVPFFCMYECRKMVLCMDVCQGHSSWKCACVWMRMHASAPKVHFDVHMSHQVFSGRDYGKTWSNEGEGGFGVSYSWAEGGNWIEVCAKSVNQTSLSSWLEAGVLLHFWEAKVFQPIIFFLQAIFLKRKGLQFIRVSPSSVGFLLQRRRPPLTAKQSNSTIVSTWHREWNWGWRSLCGGSNAEVEQHVTKRRPFWCAARVIKKANDLLPTHCFYLFEVDGRWPDSERTDACCRPAN